MEPGLAVAKQESLPTPNRWPRTAPRLLPPRLMPDMSVMAHLRGRCPPARTPSALATAPRPTGPSLTGVFGMGMPPCGKNGLNRTHGSTPFEVTSMIAAPGQSFSTLASFLRRLSTATFIG